mmetsp:Transcript_18799/g.42897  ORF Transcript_18799/g.42897 Transcript_18799/m.42897 type:complete len:460 (-) Transcript_18799:75-1454(-)
MVVDPTIYYKIFIRRSPPVENALTTQYEVAENLGEPAVVVENALPNDLSPSGADSSTTKQEKSPRHHYWTDLSDNLDSNGEDKEDNSDARLSSSVEKHVFADASRFVISRLETESRQNWDNFYRRNGTNFFKDRHYLIKAFPQIGKALEGSVAAADYGDDESFIVDKPSGRNEEKGELYTLLEIGCGVGNALLPLLDADEPMEEVGKKSDTHCASFGKDRVVGGSTSDQFPRKENRRKKKRLRVIGYDLSPVAISLLRSDPRYIASAALDPPRAGSAVWDISKGGTPPFPFSGSNQEEHTHPQFSKPLSSEVSHTSNLDPNFHMPREHISDMPHISADGAMLLFCLSSISPDRMGAAVQAAAALLCPGTGFFFFRDYGRDDEAQRKLAATRGRTIEDNFYAKQDGTRVYYFSLEDVRRLFIDVAGMVEVECKYLKRLYANRADETKRRRIWVQATFRKP